jgi:tripartite-type tricarboxylate transporter receptor subunit TctC
MWTAFGRRHATTIAGCAVGLAVSALSAAAQDAGRDSVEQFFRGKIINIYIGSAVGGGYDGYARLLARHFGQYIPGNPTVVPQNMPGAGSNKAAGYVYAQAPKDGTAIGAVQPGAVLAPLLSDQAVQHDPRKFIYLGSANSDVYLCFVRADAPAKTFKDVFTHEVILGTSGEGATLRDLPVMLDNVLGTKLRLIGGYAGSHEVTLAIEKGEVQGMCGMGWVSLSMEHPDWLSSGQIRILAQEDMKGYPDLNKMGVPLTVDFAKTDEDRQVMELIYSQAVFGRPYFLPPGVPPERVAALRQAFTAALHDKDLLAEAAKMRFDVGALSGEELQAMIARLYALPARISERAKRSLIYKPQAQ